MQLYQPSGEQVEAIVVELGWHLAANVREYNQVHAPLVCLARLKVHAVFRSLHAPITQL